MTRIRIADGPREVQVDADTPLGEAVAGALHTWHHAHATPSPPPPDGPGELGFHLHVTPAQAELAEER